MSSHFFAIGTLTVVTAIAAASAVSTLRHTHLRPATTPGGARLHVFGSRSAQQSRSDSGSKFDGALADLSRHTGLVRPDHAIEDLRSLSPAAKFLQPAAGAPPLVLIDAVTRGSPEQLKTALLGLGLQHASVYSNDVSGWLPVAALDSATARAEVHAIRAAMPRTRTGVVTSQGDFTQHSDVLRSVNTLSGAGVTVGVLSDSYNCYAVFAANGVAASGNAGYASNGFLATAATDMSTQDLPSTVNVVAEAPCMDGTHYNGYPSQLPFGDEGRAMMQIVHDVAPGAGLAFYTAENGEADFALGIGKLATAGAKVIADDVGYFDEPFFQDGIVAQAIDTVVAGGVAYFSAAGNDGTLAYDNTAPNFATVSTSTPNSGEHLLNFDASGGSVSTSLPVTIASLVPGEFVAIVVEWDQPYVTGAANSGGATSHVDVCITGASGSDDIVDNAGNAAACSGANATGADSYQVLIVGNPASAAGNTAAETLNIQVGLADGTTAPGRIKVAVEDDGAGSTINAFATNTGTVQGHPSASGAAAIGAAFYLNTPACGASTAELEDFSSQGGDPILFDISGTRLTAPAFRQKPDMVGPNGGNDTFLGFTLTSAQATTSIASCQDNLSYPNFFGTSAATPHVASIAALMLQANPAATPAQIYQALRNSALPMATASPNFQSGFGFVQADTAIAVPIMTLGATSVAAGGSTSLTWSTVDATSCTASGAWTGALAAGGNQNVALSGSGPSTYTLTCTNIAGASGTNSVILTAAAPPAPTLILTAPALAAGAIALGDSATLSWSSVSATGCTASGGWSGALPPSGTQLVTPTAAGTDSYSLTCANAVGASSATGLTLSVTAQAAPAAATLTLAATSVAAGSSTTITWSSLHAASCTASGNWSGTLATAGTQTVTPSAAGIATYTLTCANSGGTSPASSANLTFTAAASAGTIAGGSGGGTLDTVTLLALAGLGFVGFFRLQRRAGSVLR